MLGVVIYGVGYKVVIGLGRSGAYDGIKSLSLKISLREDIVFLKLDIMLIGVVANERAVFTIAGMSDIVIERLFIVIQSSQV